MDIFPISLKLQQQRCLIVGGGHIALRKCGSRSSLFSSHEIYGRGNSLRG
ncbi:NAD(P)-dependent oxidoreductase, partial [Acinetobacter baumannii]